MITLPESCLRDIEGCKPLARIKADDGGSFFCCGLNDPNTRTVEQDIFRQCFKNGDVEYVVDSDTRDLLDLMSVTAQALSAKANIDNNGGGGRE